MDAYSCAMFFYGKYLFVSGFELLEEEKGENFQLFMQGICMTLEPQISLTHASHAVLSEIYLRLLCAMAYHGARDNERAAHHIDAAIELALPDRMIMPLSEACGTLDFLIDERLKQCGGDIRNQVKKLSVISSETFVQVHNEMLGRSKTAAWTKREREIARLVAYGLSNREISDYLCISINTVKQILKTAMDKVGSHR